MSFDVEAELKTLRSEFARLQTELGHLATRFQRLASRGRREGAEHISSMIEDVEDGIRQGLEGFTKHVREKPAGPVMVTLGLGLLLGLLFASSRRH